MREVIRQKIADSIETPLPALTFRDTVLPTIPRRAHAIIGMRRAGKTCFMQQCLQERMDKGAPRESLLYFSFEDDRLEGLTAANLNWLLEEYFTQFPQFRDQRQVTLFLDEVQVVPGWETFVRRVLDNEKIEIFLSGSSAKMLSREVATSLRGRATETTIFPFSFREYLRHRRIDPPTNPAFVKKATRSKFERLFLSYMAEGGFPEAQQASTEQRIQLLQSYVDAVVFRDVIERHGIGNVNALRRLIRQLLASAPSLFSVNRFVNDMQSQGISISKDGAYAMLGHIEDAFLVRMASIASPSERKRQSNPRKTYPVDPALIEAFDPSGRMHAGRVLENLVAVELDRRGYDYSYLKTRSDQEVDFLATPVTGRPLLVQACTELTDPATRAREFRAIESAREEGFKHPAVIVTLSTIDVQAAQPEAPKNVTVVSAWEWMLGGGNPAS